MLLSSCINKKSDNDTSERITKEPIKEDDSGIIGSGSANIDYPSTAHVIKDAVTDIDGNHYDAVQIGDQIWMAENLRTTRYSDGISIEMDTFYNYDYPYRYAPGQNQNNRDNMDNVASYGYLYNWPAVMHETKSSDDIPSGVQGICPDGWHVPSKSEFSQLIEYMNAQPMYIANGTENGKSKALAAQWGWNNSNKNGSPGNNPKANNATGFSALPAGAFSQGNNYYFGDNVYLWCATDFSDDIYLKHKYPKKAFNFGFNRQGSTVILIDNDKDLGFSVRCVRD